jgi:hypothetical protein
MDAKTIGVIDSEISFCLDNYDEGGSSFGIIGFYHGPTQTIRVA